MTSPYEHGGVRRELGAPLPLLAASIGTSEVTLLEYEAIEMPLVPPRAMRGGGQADGSADWQLDQLAESERQRMSALQRSATELETVLEQGRVEGRAETVEECDERVAVERNRVIKTCEQFQKERQRYFAGVEGEVVKLALAIAAQVLHREVKLDPFLLKGVVRVALEKVSGESGTIMRVPLQEVEVWKQLVLADELVGVEVVGDARWIAGECVLETSVGRVELGVKAQLEEIETGFYDLLQQRPM